MSDFKTRLKGERKRLGLNQEKFAQVGGVTRDTQLNYENGTRKPDSGYLQCLADAGIDILFLFTGEPYVSAFTDDEKELLLGYRSLDVRGKARVLGIIEGATPHEPVRTQVSIGGSVGQQIYGDVHGTVAAPSIGKTIVKKK